MEIQVQVKLAGRRGPVVAPLVLDLDAPVCTVRELIGAVVRQQVAAFNARKGLGDLLRVITEIDLESGKIAAGDQEPDGRRADVDEAVDRALLAFRDGFYFVFVNDVQVEDLDQAVGDVRDLLFVRLTPLVGG